MNLADYFESVDGLGILGTADSEGNVDLAVYARPHVVDETTVAFIMSDRLSHQNLNSNPQAAYLFSETGSRRKGKRLYLTMTQEETDPQRIEAMRRENRKGLDSRGSKKFLVHFKVRNVRPLIGD
jgi:hypothetical protein